MRTLKLALAAAALTFGLAASASAMPVGNLGQGAGASNQVEQVRLVCNRWGRCWRTGPSYYRYGYGWNRGYHRGWRGHYRHWR